MKYIVDEARLTDIADAIRGKTGGTQALTLEQMPVEIASISGNQGFCGEGVEIIARGSVEITVGVEKYYTHFLYNGVRLPKIPEDVLKTNPYAWIRQNNGDGYYELWVSPQPWHFRPGYGIRVYDSSTKGIRYRINIESANTVDEWTFHQEITQPNVGISDTNLCIWSNHDIPNGSATATDIYFEGTEPVPTD